MPDWIRLHLATLTAPVAGEEQSLNLLRMRPTAGQVREDIHPQHQESGTDG